MESSPEKHAIITGATGFIGSACVRELLARDWRVTALGHRAAPDRLRDMREHENLCLAAAPVTRYAELVRVLAEAGPCQAIVHCAGRASDVGWDRQFRVSHLDGTRNICRAVLELDIERLVYISTTDVYGVDDFNDIDEESRQVNNRRNPYPKYKIAAEEHVRRSLPRDRFVIVRPALVWGPGDTTVLPRIIGFLRSSPAIVHFGRWRGRNRCPLAYVGNVARVVYAAATSPAALGEAYNVVDPEPITMDEYYRMLQAIFLPERLTILSTTVPLPLAWPLAALSTALSTLLGRSRPIFDPSLYALYHVAHRQSFRGTKAGLLLASCGSAFIDRATAVAELRAGKQAEAEAKMTRARP